MGDGEARLPSSNHNHITMKNLRGSVHRSGLAQSLSIGERWRDVCINQHGIAYYQIKRIVHRFWLQRRHSCEGVQAKLSLHKLFVPFMPAVSRPSNQPGDFLVDYEEKVFPDVKAEPGEKALITFHTVAFEGSIGLVNLLQASRLINKGFETSILLYGPGVTLGVQRGFPKLGDAAFDGHLNFNARLQKFMDQGGKVYACRFALQALYGHGEGALMPGIRPINPLDVLDIVLMHRKEGAFIIDTWTL
jgi:uncharacterized repeat protein (TIGR04044 family)